MSEPETILMPQVPPKELYALSGMVNHVWAQLDALVSASYVATLDIDPVEAGITLGRLETRAKVEKLKKLFRHRKNGQMVELMASMSKKIEDTKELRNAMTHGYYLAYSQGEFIWSILPEFIVTEDTSATQMFGATAAEILEHVNCIAGLCILVHENFDAKALQRLFDLPSRVRSANR